jgi:hypothetical protein
MIKRAGLWAAVLVLSVATTSCGDGEAHGSDPFFPTWEPTELAPAGEVRGTLTRAGGCVILETDREAFLPFWTEAFEFDAGSNSVVADDGVALHVGDEVALAGGERSLTQAEELTSTSVPAACAVGNAWMVTGSI